VEIRGLRAPAVVVSIFDVRTLKDVESDGTCDEATDRRDTVEIKVRTAAVLMDSIAAMG
jgi:hypothetical protein